MYKRDIPRNFKGIVSRRKNNEEIKEYSLLKMGSWKNTG